MCEECFLNLSQRFKEMSEQAESDEEYDIAEGLADLSLLSFTSMQLKNSKIFNMMLQLLTLSLVDQRKMSAIQSTINYAMKSVEEEKGNAL